jgi:hypothetical protein
MTDDPRHGPPPIEPLSEAAWARVERGIWSELETEHPAAPARARRWWLVAAPLAAAAAVATLVLILRPGPTPDKTPTRVVAQESAVSVQFADSHIELEPWSAVVMNDEAAHPMTLLERGAAWFTVAPRNARPAFIVRAGDVVVRVVGTKFQVARSDERIAVEVEHGQVDVNYRGSIVPVGAGQRWSSDAPNKVLAVAATPPSVDPAVVVAPPASPTPPATTPPPASPTPPTTAPPRPHRPRPGSGSAGVHSEPTPPPSAPITEIDGDRDRDRDEYDRLAALEPRSPEAALTGYLTLAKGNSRWADPALFAAARLAADRHDRRAETLLGIYLQRFPSGANAADARQLLARLRAGKSE